MGRIKNIILAAIGETKTTRPHLKEASEAGVDARQRNAERRKRNALIEDLKEVEEYKEIVRARIKKEEQEKIDAVNEALAGFMDAQQDTEMLAQGFHPDSTPNERMTMQVIQLLSHHFSPLTSKWGQQSTPAFSASAESTPGSLEDIALGSMVSPIPPNSPQQLTPEAQPLNEQKLESGMPANFDRLMGFLETLGLKKESLAKFGVFPEKIDPSKINLPWLVTAAELVQQIQVQ